METGGGERSHTGGGRSSSDGGNSRGGRREPGVQLEEEEEEEEGRPGTRQKHKAKFSLSGAHIHSISTTAFTNFLAVCVHVISCQRASSITYLGT